VATAKAVPVEAFTPLVSPATSRLSFGAGPAGAAA
jgi:hypothetical protein